MLSRSSSMVGSHCSKPPGGCTMTLVNMSECDVPQYSAHSIGYSPGTVAWNQTSEKRPGTASIFTRKFGIQKLCSTSTALITTRTLVLTGTWSTSSVM